MKTILITGATGFLGGALARRLWHMGFKVTASGRNPTAAQRLMEEGIRFVPAELTDAGAVESLCRGQDVVFHCAALSAPWGPYKAFFRSNVTGTQNVVRGCLRHGVQRLIHISTPSIYFDGKDRINVRETDPLPEKPLNAYVATKRQAEGLVVQAYQSGLGTIIVRPRALYGPGDSSLFPRLLSALQKRRLPIIGSGDNVADLTYIEDALDALVLCLEAPARALGKAYNISGGKPVRLWDFIAKLCKRLGLPGPCGHLSFRRAMWLAGGLEAAHKLIQRNKEPPLTRFAVISLAKSQTLNIEAARRNLGFRPRIRPQQGLERLRAWWEENR